MVQCNFWELNFTTVLRVQLRMIVMLLVVKFHESIKQEAKFTWNMQRALNMCFHVAVIFFVVYRAGEDEELEVCNFSREWDFSANHSLNDHHRYWSHMLSDCWSYVNISHLSSLNHHLIFIIFFNLFLRDRVSSMRCHALEIFIYFFMSQTLEGERNCSRCQLEKIFKLLIDLQHSLSHSVRSCARCFR